ncbi:MULTISPECIES: glycosyltransferase [unclassified Duganella]|jgi:sterol 3beta-glucosyltransferase|uniref:glycosyltransferase n=1 Tax=unclassified Duganella TaxID=2636909 RepID=UPI000882DFC7|nr:MULTISPECIES: glycosyltransferase [unclassified Duganella]SDG36925.1 sterol 3beta-glucosyltransferase [Duganella sp. OV458]SDJ66622.1 UDP:flavonoid glycosyltransferase YjiC, YdhE family [Duganella sp. OV510]
MKIGLQTWGSHGDIRPFVALAEGLQLAGYEVTLVLTCVDSDAYAALSSPSGVKIRVVASPVISLAEVERLGEAAARMVNPFAQTKMLIEGGFLPAEEEMFAAAQQLAAECDVLIGHFFLYPLQIAAEHARKPYVSVLLSHVMVPSAHSHPVGLPFAQGLLWRITRWALHKTASRYPNRLRARLGMAPIKDILTEVWMSPKLTLLGVSPQICARQPDWPSSIQVTGFLDMPNMQLEGRLTEAVEAFLAAGDAPVYMTFGSWTPRDIPHQSDNLRLLSDAARLAGCRAIIQTPDAAACGFHSDERILYVSASPHHLIFPRCGAVVHHGGAGTTQSTTLAGRPSVVVANIAEQEHWGQELQRLGIAGKPLRRRNVSARKIAARISALRPDMPAKAAAIARAMAQENGVAAAVRIINEKFGAGNA